MTDTVENQSIAPAASSEPAVGETSPQAPAAQPQGQAPAQSAEPPKPAPQTAGQTEDGDDDGDQGNGKRPSRSQRLQRRVQLLTAELDDMRRTVPAARPAQDAGTARTGDASDAPPKEADFNGDFFAYQNALSAFHVRQAAREAVRSEAERDRTERAQAREVEVRRERVLAHYERVDELKERVPDFDDTMKQASSINLRDEVAAEILASEKSALIQYHLAKNPDKARDLNSLTGRELARAVGRLEGAVRLPAAKRVTEATPPVAPLAGGASPTFDPFKAEMADYAANYRQRVTAREKARA